MSETLRDHAKRIVRSLAACDHASGIYRDGLSMRDFVHKDDYLAASEDTQDAVKTLRASAYSVWLEAYKAIERERLLKTWPTAACLLELWERPWSGKALRFAAHRLEVLQARGISVLEEAEL